MADQFSNAFPDDDPSQIPDPKLSCRDLDEEHDMAILELVGALVERSHGYGLSFTEIAATAIPFVRNVKERMKLQRIAGMFGERF